MVDISSTSVLVMNVTKRGIVAQVESATSEGTSLCFLTTERARILGITVPTKASTWGAMSSTDRSKKDAFAKYAKASAQALPHLLTPYPLTLRGEPWYIKDTDNEPWYGLKLVL